MVLPPPHVGGLKEHHLLAEVVTPGVPKILRSHSDTIPTLIPIFVPRWQQRWWYTPIQREWQERNTPPENRENYKKAFKRSRRRVERSKVI